MSSNRILLTDWAKKKGIKTMDAKNMARRGKLKTAKCLLIPVLRWTVEADEKIPNQLT